MASSGADISSIATSGIVGLGASIYGGIKSAQANREGTRLLDKQFEENEAFFNNRANRDFLETNAAKGITERLRKKYQDQNKIAENRAVVTGATPEAEIAAKGQNNDSYNDAMSRIAEQGTDYQTRQEYMYRNNLSDLYRQRMALIQQKAESAANVAAAGADSLSTAANLGATGGDTAKGIDPALALAQEQKQIGIENVRTNEKKWLDKTLNPLMSGWSNDLKN